MPQPTRQQFDAASKRVLASAPAGLSREQFFDLIAKEIQAGDPSTWTSENGRVTHDSPGGAQAAKLESGEIPSTWIGGVLKSIKDQTMTPQLGHLMEASAHPETAGDFLSLLVPQGIGRSSNLVKEMEEAGQAASRGARGTGLLNRVRSYWRGVGEDIQGKPTTTARGEMNLPPNGVEAAVPASAAPLAEGRDLYSTYKNNAPEPIPPRARPTPQEPISVGGHRIDPKDKRFQKLLELTDEAEAASGAPKPNAQDMLKAELERVDPRISGLPPEGQVPPPTGVKPETALDKMSERIGMGQENPNPETIGPGPIREPDPLAAELMGGTSPAPRVLSLKADKIPPELWPELRRYYGAEKLAQLTGKSVEEIERLAPGPSRIPVEAVDRMNQNPDGIFKYLP